LAAPTDHVTEGAELADADDLRQRRAAITGRPSTTESTPGHSVDGGVTDEADNRSLVLFDRGDEVVVETGDEGIRFLLVSGEPLKEPVAWHGPIVMNTREQLQQAFAELQEGTFLKNE